MSSVMSCRSILFRPNVFSVRFCYVNSIKLCREREREDAAALVTAWLPHLFDFYACKNIYVKLECVHVDMPTRLYKVYMYII